MCDEWQVPEHSLATGGTEQQAAKAEAERDCASLLIWCPAFLPFYSL